MRYYLSILEVQMIISMKIFIQLFFLILNISLTSQILPERERAAKVDQILKNRYTRLLPELMDRAKVGMWILICREYNEDPVLRTMLPATWLHARRRTMLVISKEKTGIQKYAISRYNVGEHFTSAWDKEKQPDQWKALVTLIKDKDPSTIAINTSENYGIADGISKTDYTAFLNALPVEYHKKVVSAESLAVSWIETRTPLEMEIYEDLVELTHDVIKEAFSTKVITVGVTSTDDVVWWLRQKVTELGVETWFHPTVDVQRANTLLSSQVAAFSDRPGEKIIQSGDLIHCDFGISYLRLQTDCQQHAYVLKEGEDAPPDYLKEAFKKGNEVQDIFTNTFKTGLTGNEILLTSLKKAKVMGLRPSIYTHPLGIYGHSAGPTIGMWDAQEGVPGTGDYPLYENTVYAIELNTTVKIPEWKKDIRIMLEEAGFWGADGFKYVNKRQTELITIP